MPSRSGLFNSFSLLGCFLVLLWIACLFRRVQGKDLGTLTSYLPHWVVEQFPSLTGWDKFRKTVDGPTEFIIQMVKETLEKKNKGSDDFIHAYNDNVNATTDLQSSFHGDAGSKLAIFVKSIIVILVIKF